MPRYSDDFQEDSGFEHILDEMDRAERKRQRKIERKEVLWGPDSPLWSMFDSSGNKVDQESWYVRMPSDRLMAALTAAQNNFFSVLSQRRQLDKQSPEYEALTIKVAEYNDRINFLQDCLLRQSFPSPEEIDALGFEECDDAEE